MTRQFRRILLVVLAAMLPASAALAQGRPSGPPAATVRIDQLQVAFIASGSAGGGVLKVGGRSYPFRIGGLGIGGIGASELKASGVVYGLRRVADFEGPYVSVRSGWALGDAGRGRLWLRNDNGVYMRLVTQRRGLSLTLGADGVIVAFKR